MTQNIAGAVPYDFYSISVLINFITSTFLTFFIIAKNPQGKISQTFAWFLSMVGFWSLFFFLFFITGDRFLKELYLRTCMIGVIFMPSTFFHFTYYFLQKNIKVAYVYLNYAVSFLLALIVYSPLFADDFSGFLIFPWWGKAGVIFPVHLLQFLVSAVYTDYFMVARMRQSAGAFKQQIKIVLVGVTIGFVSGGFNYFVWYRIPVPPIPNILVSLGVATIAYGIVRHRLMDIEVVIKKTLVFASLFAIVLGLFMGVTLITQELLAGGRLLGLAMSSIIIIFAVRPLEDRLLKITDRYLFQKKYDYRELLRTFTTEVLTVLDLDKLLRLTVDKLTDIIKVKSCAVMIFDEQEERFHIRAAQGVKDEGLTLAKSDNIAAFFEETHGYISVSELKDKKMSVHEEIKGIIDSLDAELIIPMVLHDKVIGILSLGKKKSDEDYTQDDLDILLPLSRTLAIGISNAELFEELGKTQAEAAQREKMAVIGTLSAGINHEICNPLSIARGQCEAFLLNIKDGLYDNNSAAELLEKAKEIMAKVIKETDRATTITKKLSGFAKPSKGEAELVNIAQEVQDVLGLVGYELKLEKVEISKDIATDLPNIFVDRKQFQEVLFNLIRNAGQAIGEKGKIAITAKEHRGKVSIDIQDTGSGIPEDKIKQLFNPFFTTKDPGKGTGLGLFIVRQVVEKNGGWIYLKSTKVGEGTVFTVEFPAAAAQEAKV